MINIVESERRAVDSLVHRREMPRFSTAARELNHKILGKFGWGVVLKSSTFNTQRNTVIRRLGMDLALDVGANEWASAVRTSGYAGTILSFEPDPRAISILRKNMQNDQEWKLYETALGNETSELIMFQFPEMVEGMSSLKRPLNFTKFGEEIVSSKDLIHEVLVPVRRLDDLLEDIEFGNKKIHLKIDVQGFEMEVLQGSPCLLEKCSSVEIEMPLVNFYDGAVQFLELSKLLIDLGFTASTIQTERWSYPAALDCDALFIRT
jgi:FkbM family methyltransferase